VLPPRLFHEDLYLAVRELDRVHGDGELPDLPVLIELNLEPDGRFIARGIEPSTIVLRANGPYRGFTLLHEIGHLIDYCAFPEPGSFASESGWDELAPWRDACEASRTRGQLTARIAALLQSLPTASDTERRRLLRMLELSEFWARSYAQYVATRSGHPELVADLNAQRASSSGRVYYPLHWDDDDFRPIGEAIETLFRRIGWRTASTT
jgi:hypothetical protein